MTQEGRVSGDMRATEISLTSGPMPSGSELISGKHSDGIYARLQVLQLTQKREGIANDDIASQIRALQDQYELALKEEAEEENRQKEARVAAENAARRRTAQQTQQAQLTQQAQQTQQAQLTQQAHPTQQTQTT